MITDKNAYKIINGKWTFNGNTFNELSLKQREALWEYVLYEYPNE